MGWGFEHFASTSEFYLRANKGYQEIAEEVDDRAADKPRVGYRNGVRNYSLPHCNDVVATEETFRVKEIPI